MQSRIRIQMTTLDMICIIAVLFNDQWALYTVTGLLNLSIINISITHLEVIFPSLFKLILAFWDVEYIILEIWNAVLVLCNCHLASTRNDTCAFRVPLPATSVEPLGLPQFSLGLFRDSFDPPDLCFLDPSDPRDSNYARFSLAHALIYPIHQVANPMSG